MKYIKPQLTGYSRFESEPDILQSYTVNAICKTCMVCNKPSKQNQYVFWRNKKLCGTMTGYYFWTHCNNVRCLKHVKHCRNTFEDHVLTKFPSGFLDIFENKHDIRIIVKDVEYTDGCISFDSFSWNYSMLPTYSRPDTITIMYGFDHKPLIKKIAIISFDDLIRWNV
jgi:hypothetical protein